MKPKNVKSIGRPPRSDKPKKRTYYLPVGLADTLLAAMDKKTSRAVAAGIVMFLAAPERVQEEAMDVAASNPPQQAIREVKRRLPEWMEPSQVARHLGRLSSKERSRLIQLDTSKTPTKSR